MSGNAAVGPDWIRPEGLVVPPGLRLSFQRFACAADPMLKGVPSSMGALPVGFAADQRALLLPLADGEGFWIGLSVAEDGLCCEVSLALEIETGECIDALTGERFLPDHPRLIEVPPSARIEGIRPLEGGMLPIAHRCAHAPCVRKLQFRVGTARQRRSDSPEERSAANVVEFALQLVAYEAFAARCGRALPLPLDPDAGYKGWRLP